MAESDAAGPGSPGGRNARALTREDIDRLLAEAEREWESLTPEERARRQAESEKADREAYEAAMEAARPTLEAFDSATRAARPILEAIERAAGSGLGRLFDPPPEDPRWIVGNQPLDPALLKSIEPVRRPLSEEEIRAAVADEVRKAIAEAALKKDRKPRGDSTCERLRDLHTNIDPEFAETASLRKLAERIERSTGALHESTYYQTKLKPIRAEIAARKREAKKAQKWGDFNSVGRLDEADEDH
jgi:hypothetical protein